MLKLLIPSVLVVLVRTETKFWSPPEQDQSVLEWYLYPIKCPKTALKFEGDDELEFIEGHSHEKQIIFAQSGWYVFQDQSQLIIGDTPLAQSSECINASGEEVSVAGVKSVPWSSPENWKSASNDNPAKPDIEKIPCDADEVVFNSTVTRVNMDGLFQLQMKRVSIHNKWLTSREFSAFCKTIIGQKMFDNSESIDFSQPMGDPSIKACQSNTNFYQNLVCEQVTCPLSHCIDAIRPLGFCCPVCGSSAQIEIHPNSNIRINELNNLLARRLSQETKLAFHASFFNHKTKFILQVSIMENGEYSGKSVQAMTRFAEEVLKRRFDNLVILKSGTAYDPTIKSNLFALVFMPFLFVVSILLLAYKFSYDETNFNWRNLVHRFTGRSQFIFAQFENVLEGHENEGRIVISHSESSPSESVVETGIEMVAGGPEDKTQSMPKDQLDEVVETISTADLISVDM